MSNVVALRKPVDEEWLSPAQVCEVVPGMSVTILERLRGKGQGPRYFKPTPKVVVYARADIDAWVSASVHSVRDAGGAA